MHSRVLSLFKFGTDYDLAAVVGKREALKLIGAVRVSRERLIHHCSECKGRINRVTMRASKNVSKSHQE